VNFGPRVSDLQLENLIDLIFTIKASAYSFEAANPRHEHEWRMLEKVKLPDGKILIPGAVTRSNVMIEHPEVVADHRTLGPHRRPREPSLRQRLRTMHAAHLDGGPTAPHPGGNRIRCRVEPGFHPSGHAATADIPDDITDEELKIAASTPGGQLKAAGILERGPLKRAPRRQIIHDRAQPGVGFGLQAAVPAVVIK
jgi:hypothetical protein